MRQAGDNGDRVRSSALWGKGGRGASLLVTLVLALTLPLAATAAPTKHDKPPKAPANGAVAVGAEADGPQKAFVPPALLEAAQASKDQLFRVIVQGDGSQKSDKVAKEIAKEAAKSMSGSADENAASVLRDQIKEQFSSVDGVAAELTGKQIVKLSKKKGILSITEDVPVVLATYSNKQTWVHAAGAAKFFKKDQIEGAPAIAIVDSGIEASRADFGERVLAEVNLARLGPNSAGDGRGHGTFVAGIAAGAAPKFAGAAPEANLVSIDVMNDRGMALTSDVIRAADWILANKDEYGIRVANFSLHSSRPASFLFDPLNKAVERLWFAGVVVVASSGNYGTNGSPTGLPFAPGNDPFVITVGAADVHDSAKTNDDFIAPWSAYGYTLDGFAKPELSAPGRFMIGPVPTSSTLASDRPERVVAPGYMELSGTSFAAPVVAGAAAYVLALHPDWTPDQVKGALMLTASPVPKAAPLSAGVGEVNAARAVAVVDPPNPNLALSRFLVADAAGGTVPVFDAASWANTAKADASWANASWANASWANASWANASWANFSYENAGSDSPVGGDYVDPAELWALESEDGVDYDDDGVIGTPAPAAPAAAPVPVDPAPAVAAAPAPSGAE